MEFQLLKKLFGHDKKTRTPSILSRNLKKKIRLRIKIANDIKGVAT